MINEKEINEAAKRKIELDPSEIDKLLSIVPLCFKRKFAACHIIEERFSKTKEVRSTTIQRIFGVSQPTADSLKNSCGCD